MDKILEDYGGVITIALLGSGMIAIFYKALTFITLC